MHWMGQLTATVAAFGLLARYLSPELFWPPAVFVLLLPFLLLLTLVYALYCLLRRRWSSIWWPALVLSGSLPVLALLLATGKSGTATTISPGPQLTIVTGNQRIFRTADFTTVDSATVYEQFAAFGADVLLLQEVLPIRYPQSFIPSIHRASGLADRHQQLGTTLATYGDGITEVSTHFLPPNEYNGFVVSDIPTALGTIRFVNAHLESNKISDLSERVGGTASLTDQGETVLRMLRGYGHATRRRAEQAAEIRRVVEESPYPVIVGGDFNDVPSSYTYRALLSPRLRDSWLKRGRGLGTTFTGRLPGLRIDYLLVDTSLQVRQIERLGAEWSDHRPLRVMVGR